MLSQQVIRNRNIVEHLVGLEQSAVIGEYLVFLTLEARIHIAEILLHTVVERAVFVHLLQLFPLVDNLHHRVGRQQTAILCEEDEEQAVEQLLSLLEEQQLPLLLVLAFGDGIILQDIGKECALELRVVTIKRFGNLVF